jgi:carbon storage regulator
VCGFRASACEDCERLGQPDKAVPRVPHAYTACGSRVPLLPTEDGLKPLSPVMEDAMLVLSRRTNEDIIIDGHIIVRVVSIRGDKCRIGIVAPKTMTVHRKEIQDMLETKQCRSTPSSGKTTNAAD